MFKRVLSVALLFVLLQPFAASAAALYIDPPFSELYRGDAITLSVRLDVDEDIGECINAIDGVLEYNPVLDPVDISVGDSIISLWPEKPRINRENNTITFAGGIPNGYCGRVSGDPRLTNTLLKVVFRLPGFSVGTQTDAATGTVAFTDQTTLYLNDGRGTRIAPSLYPAKITLHKEGSTDYKNDWQDSVDADTIPPEKFSIELESNKSVYNGRYYITFNTTDKQTGIDQYQVIEEPLSQFGAFEWGRADAPWITLEGNNVYVLKDQSLNSTIRVKAIDKAGNEYIATLVPDESMRTISQSQIYFYAAGIALIILIVLVVITVVVYLKRARRRIQNEVQTTPEEEYDVITEDDHSDEGDEFEADDTETDKK